MALPEIWGGPGAGGEAAAPGPEPTLPGGAPVACCIAEPSKAQISQHRGPRSGAFPKSCVAFIRF